MSVTIAQFITLLNLLPEPARVYDVQGRVVADNQAARGATWPDDNGGDGQARVSTIELGDGWYLRRLDSSEPLPLPHQAASGLPLARLDLHSLLGGISHELRNPMAAILTAVSLLQDDAGISEESMMLLGVVRKEARRMNQILTEFSLYVKPPQPHPENFDLVTLLHESLERLQSESALWQNVEMHDQLPSELQVHADSNQIQQALLRIFENAGEAMSKNPHPTLTLHGRADSDAKRIILCVEDNGAGFSSDDLQSAFLPFYSTKPQSTGLGLSTAQVAVQAAGGALWLENLSNRESPALDSEHTVSGARLCCVLPAAK